MSYINGDLGKTADVDHNSSCYSPDRYDKQNSIPAAGNPGADNVHNDACFLDDRGNKVGKDIGATFQSAGTGSISACPDPEGAGPAVARLRDLNGDGRNDSCFQSHLQEKGIAGDGEHHARLDNTSMTGGQQVPWGRDDNGDGRIHRRNDDELYWSTNGLGRWRQSLVAPDRISAISGSTATTARHRCLTVVSVLVTGPVSCSPSPAQQGSRSLRGSSLVDGQCWGRGLPQRRGLLVLTGPLAGRGDRRLSRSPGRPEQAHRLLETGAARPEKSCR